MLKKVLIANRGEIAVRIIRACRELDIETVAVFSSADADALHTHMANEAVCIGPAASQESYLNMQNILSAATMLGVDGVHPGFGFLSENAKFAKILSDCKITFIGPPPEVIEAMGDKSKAREAAKKAGVPIIPGSEGVLKDAKQAKALADKIGYPVMIKAAAGGGGRGIRLINKKEEIESAFLSAQAEAIACFADGSLYMEKVVCNARHVEIQILADNFGKMVHLGERDCSMQLRNQKVLEETPCVALDPELRKEMGKAALRLAKQVGYQNAGTVEFLLEASGNFYFMEMNTRVQVEHPVTEMVTSVDIVKEQLRIASGMKLRFSQDDVLMRGHSIECRINAGNPLEKAIHSDDTVTLFHAPGGPGTRFDTALYSGYTIPPYYDSMLGKLIVHSSSRESAINKMKRAITELVIEGPQTNIDFQLEILNDMAFIKGDYDTSFISRMLSGLN